MFSNDYMNTNKYEVYTTRRVVCNAKKDNIQKKYKKNTGERFEKREIHGMKSIMQEEFDNLCVKRKLLYMSPSYFTASVFIFGSNLFFGSAF